MTYCISNIWFGFSSVVISLERLVLVLILTFAWLLSTGMELLLHAGLHLYALVVNLSVFAFFGYFPLPPGPHWD